MSQTDEIESQTGKIRLKDQFHWAFLGSAAWKTALLLPSVMFLIFISILLLSGQTMTFRIVFIEAIFPSLVVLIMLAVWTSFFVFMGYRRLTQNQRTNTWSFSDEGVAVKDQAGNQILRPWSQVAYVKYSSKGLRIACRPMGSFWIPERFFNAHDLVKLKKLTKKLKLS